MRKFICMLLFAALLGLIGCGKGNKNNQSGPLFDVTIDETPQTAKLSELFPDAKLVKLETNDSSLLVYGNMRIIYRDGIFYIRSANQITMFDGDGKYIGRISHHGGGPGEYERLSAFDVVRHNGRNEVWIPNNGEILRYEVETDKYVGSIKPRFNNQDAVIRDIFYVNDSTVLAATDDEVRIKVIDPDGNIRREFMEYDVANSGTGPIAFRRNGNLVYSPVVYTNQAVVYSIDADTLGFRPLINPDDKIVTMKARTDAYESEGMMGFNQYTRENYISIMGLANHGDDVLISFLTPDGKRYFGVSKNGETRFYTYGEEGTLENDLVPGANYLYPVTMASSQNDTGFILNIEGEGDDNPYLLVIE